MNTYRSYEEIKQDLEMTVKWYEVRIAAWENVKIVTKKDGTPFKVYSKNFDGADIEKYTPVEDYANPYLTVCFRDERGRWESDQFPLDIGSGYLTAGLPEENEEREVRVTAWGNSHAIATPAEAGIMLKNLIKKYRENKAEAERELEMSKAYFDKVEAKCEEIRGILKEIKGERLSSHFVYDLEDYIGNTTRFI